MSWCCRQSRPACLGARRAVASLLDRLDVDLWVVQLVVSEVVANAVLHAYPDRAPGQVRLEAWLEDELLTVVVADDGVGMSSGRGSQGLGEGLALIRRLAREVELYGRSGTRLVMRLQLVGGVVASAAVALLTIAFVPREPRRVRRSRKSSRSCQPCRLARSSVVLSNTSERLPTPTQDA